MKWMTALSVLPLLGVFVLGGQSTIVVANIGLILGVSSLFLHTLRIQREPR